MVAIQMDQTGIVVCAVVGSLGVLSAIFGFSAEGTKLTPYTILVYDDECIYPPNPALALAVCAIVFLLLAQIIISAFGRCCCKSRATSSETNKRIVGIICSVVSWIAAVIAVVLLGEGASWNANVVRIGPAPFCPYLKDGVLAGAAVLALVATALGITSFIMLRSEAPAPAVAAAAAGGAPNNLVGEQQLPAGIAIGRPQNLPAAVKASEQPPTAELALGHPQFPSNPQGYGQAQVAPTVSHAQAGYVHAPQTPQFLPQGYGPHAPNAQYFPHPLPQGGHPANTAPAGVQFPSSPPQVVYAQPPSYAPQHPAAAQPQAYVQVPVPPAPSQGCEEAQGQTGIRKEDPARTPVPGDIFLPSMSDSTQDGGQDANCD